MVSASEDDDQAALEGNTTRLFIHVLRRGYELGAFGDCHWAATARAQAQGQPRERSQPFADSGPSSAWNHLHILRSSHR